MPVDVEMKRKFMRFLDVKRAKHELDQEMKGLKLDFLDVLKEQNPDGLGKLLIMEDLGAGVVFKEMKSGVSVTKLRELGVAEEIIKEATGTYIGMDVFTK